MYLWVSLIKDAHRAALKHQSVVISGEKVYYYHTEDSVLQLLRGIETGTTTPLELFMQLKDVCKMLPEYTILQYLSNNSQSAKLSEIIIDLLLGTS